MPGWFDQNREFWGQIGEGMGGQPSAPNYFNTENIWDYGDNQQVYDLAQQTGQDRDALLTQREQFLRPLYSQYRERAGGAADEGDAALFNDPNFRSFAQTGQMPQTLGQLGTGAASQQYGFGSAIAPFTGQFNAPSAQDALNTPGLQYALGRAQQAIERSAAAKGTLLTGGTLRDLSENQIGMALQGYGDAYNRSRSEFDLGRSIFESNQDRPFDKLYRLGELGRPV
jgi:hypothetical protein